MTTIHPYNFSTDPPQNTIIFEPDTDLRKNSRSQLAGNYLGDILKYCPYGSGKAIVTKMEYHKMGAKNTCHEFLVCYAEDRHKIHGQVAIITIECCGIVDAPQRPQGGEPQASLTSLSCNSLTSLSCNSLTFLSSNSSIPSGSHSSKPSGSLCSTTEDKFRITCAPKVKPVKLWLLSTLYFDHSSLVVEELAVATKVASEVDKQYHIVTNQCLWFTFLIWNIVCHVKDSDFCKVALEKDRMGTFSGLLLLHTNASSIFWFKAHGKLADIIGTYHMQWKQWVLDIKAKKMEKEALAKELSEVIKRQQEEIEMQRLEIEQQWKEISDLRVDKPVI
ncbi:hypothetical protein F5146DRAFT_1143834 [Armillaria mellea]|nr:hypothetical protein F5146DRAFT_1143834 [Armillaria mellea]